MSELTVDMLKHNTYRSRNVEYKYSQSDTFRGKAFTRYAYSQRFRKKNNLKVFKSKQMKWSGSHDSHEIADKRLNVMIKTNSMQTNHSPPNEFTASSGRKYCFHNIDQCKSNRR